MVVDAMDYTGLVNQECDLRVAALDSHLTL